MRSVIILTTLVIALGACGSTETSSAVTDVATASVDLENAEDVRADERLGDPVPLGSETTDGHVTAIASNPIVGGDESGPWLEIDLRIDNPSDEDVQFFNSTIACSGNDEDGGTVQGGTLDSAALPAGTFGEGTQFLLLPGDGRYGEPIMPCQTPAVVRIEVIGEDGFVPDQAMTWSIPDDVIDEINAAIP